MPQDSVHKETREFQAATKQLLDLMIHSIYTDRKIFLRELISNSSDAIDKLRFAALTNQDLLEGQEANFEIYLVPDETTRTLTISDNGMGMTYDEVIENIGTIAKSGTKAFLEKMKESSSGADELIGQFGVGFYSAFMVAKQVTVMTRSPGQTNGVRWESTGDGTYTIEEFEKKSRGTTIILSLHDEHCSAEHPEENFMNRYTLENLVKKYSDYIRYPIKMNVMVSEKPRDEEDKIIPDEPAIETVEVRTLNSMVSLWTKNKNDITTEEYNEFYKNMFHDWEDPLEIVHSKVEGAVEYTTVLFIPAHAPFDFFQRESTSGIRLYSKNVFIMDNCKELLPEYLRFVRGLVDSSDFSLNISRELLQQSSQLKKVGKNLEKTILKTLENMVTKERPKYESFWKEYGKAIKTGVYTDYQSRDKLQELLLFPTSRSADDLCTLAEYTQRMTEGQNVIYYATGKDHASVERLPQMELLKDKGIEVLYLFDRVDEFAIDALREYKGKKMQSISRGDLNLEDISSDDKKEEEKNDRDHASLLSAVKNQLGGKVAEARISHRLKSSPVCLVSGASGISLSMEQILAEMDQKSMFKAQRILELNPAHEIFSTIKKLFEENADSQEFKDYCELLYGQALLLEGLTPEDPISFANKVSALMAKK